MTEVADIFREFGPKYRKAHKLTQHTHKVMNAIERCRTSAMGGHVEECDTCGHIKISYNSCRNRHCPKCQGLAREKWLLARERDLLPVGYFHIVFTVPNDLNAFALRNQKEIYTLLFKASSETLMELGKDSKYLGAEIGHISILHTWGQNLMDHPHVHCIVPAGGLSLDGERWIHSRKNFFIPIKVISRVYRGKFMAYFKEACQKGKIKFEGELQRFVNTEELKVLVNALYQKEWIVYCKEPFSNPMKVMEYLGRYTHRVAISNERIIGIKKGRVSFKWKDYADQNKHKTMELEGEEFIRRFLLHVLPLKFVKIRHYGILSNRSRNIKLTRCQDIFEIKKEKRAETKHTWEELLLQIKGIDVRSCPICHKGKMIKKELILPKAYSPPTKSIA
ncbi:IS91 family transposase [Desulfitobacterium metallireducens]|uniref:Transposase n=1 Tax=Desulfitobacterium metallireducens DSM 15288 TaxID=871968 RepID=W0E5T7_9FIRM|nr:IS91 family transposase [Desulfitobacterium metallireducens]AHF06205.1 transposase [Desulfitobacterium metallireducens DSM 15288]